MHRVHTAVAHGGERGPPVGELGSAVLVRGLLRVVAARHDEDHVRLEGANLLPADADAVGAACAEAIDASGKRDHLRHPVACVERRREPLQAGDLRRVRFGQRANGFEPLSQGRDQHVRAEIASGGAAHGFNVGEHIFKRMRRERDDLRLAR